MIMLVGHASTPDELEVVTSSAATVDAYATFVDSTQAAPPAPENPNAAHALISSATTTVLTTAPTNATIRVRGIKSISLRNRDASASCQVTVQIDRNSAGTDVVQLHSVTLAPGECLEYDDQLGWYELAASPAAVVGTNKSTAAQGPGFSTDTYITNSDLLLDGIGAISIGRTYCWRVSITKTAAGTATPIIQIRVGTAASTSDTSRVTFTFGAGTAAADTAEVEIEAMFSAVGGSAVLRCVASAACLPSTGWSSTSKALFVASSAFDATPANSKIGLSYNGGTSASHTINIVRAFTEQR